jgi:putative sterol carrier protein
MASFTSADDVRTYIGGIFEQALRDAQLGPKLRSTGVVLKMITTDPDATLVIDLNTERIELGSPDDPADATMRMSSDIANRFWQGKANLPVAMARGTVKVEGKIAALLKLVPSTKQLFPAYVALLERDGRADLLAD